MSYKIKHRFIGSGRFSINQLVSWLWFSLTNQNVRDSYNFFVLRCLEDFISYFISMIEPIVSVCIDIVHVTKLKSANSILHTPVGRF